MKKIQRLFILLCSLFLLISSAAPVFAANTEFRVLCPAAIPEVGSSFTVSVMLSGNVGFNAIQLKLLYDDSVVRCDSASGGKLMDGMFQSSNAHGTRGGVGAMLAAASSDTITGDGEVGVFKFTVINAGTPKFSLSDIVLTDENREELPHSITMIAIDETGTPQETSQEAPQDTKQPKVFSDVPENHWAADYISQASSFGLITGYGDGTFQPDKPITRAQFVTILWRMAGEPQAAEASSFADVSETAYYAKAVSWANENGYVSGIAAGRFDPDGNITREQVMAILHRYAGSPIGLESMLSGIYDNQFSDSASISNYAKNAVYWAVYNGIVTGTGQTTISPKLTATRAQIAVIFLRYIQQNNQ